MSSENDVKAAVAGPAQPDNNPWPARLESWKKFSEKFHERGCYTEKRYEDERDSADQNMGNNSGDKRVNMFYSNVSVIKESLFNSLPKPVVSRMHTADWDNDAARVAAMIMQRGLTYEIKCAPSFETAVKASILDRLVPGMGTLWVNFNGPEGTVPEHITVDIVYWKDLIYEPQRAWEQVTWVGRKLHVDKEVARKKWGNDAVGPDTGKSRSANTIDEAINDGKTCVIQMWDKNTKTVIHMTPEGKVLTTTPDPYQLRKFFPTPKPLIACPPTRRFLPMSDYYMAQDQYIEMDVLYCRINLIIEAVRVAGIYDSSHVELSRMLSGSENKLIPVDNWAMLAEKGGIKGVVDWFPIQEIVTVLTHLVTAYEFIKTQLFEVTGMADIVRGSTNQYETAAAQQIKAQFASVRMNGFSRDVAFFVKDTINIMGEMMVQLYSDQKLQFIVGGLPEADLQYLEQAAQILRNDYMLHYQVDIEADSLTQADWGLQQQERMTYAQSLSQFLTSSLPVAQQYPTLAPLLVQIIKFMSVGFKGSSELEGTLDSTLDQLMQAAQEPPPPEEPSPEEVKAQAEAQKAQADLQMAQQTNLLKQQDREAEYAHKQRMNEAELEYKRVNNAMELEQKEQLFVIETREKAVKGVIEDARDRAQFEEEQRRTRTKFENEEFRENTRTAADVSRSAVKEKAKDKGKPNAR